MKASEVTEPGYYWVREPGYPERGHRLGRWQIVEATPGYDGIGIEFWLTGSDIGRGVKYYTLRDAELFGPITPPDMQKAKT